jgi:hypothetical protein
VPGTVTNNPFRRATGTISLSVTVAALGTIWRPSDPRSGQNLLRQLMDPGIPVTPRLDLATVNILMKRAARQGVSFETLIEDILKREAGRPDAEDTGKAKRTKG